MGSSSDYRPKHVEIMTFEAAVLGSLVINIISGFDYNKYAFVSLVASAISMWYGFEYYKLVMSQKDYITQRLAAAEIAAFKTQKEFTDKMKIDIEDTEWLSKKPILERNKKIMVIAAIVAILSSFYWRHDAADQQNKQVSDIVEKIGGLNDELKTIEEKLRKANDLSSEISVKLDKLQPDLASPRNDQLLSKKKPRHQ